MMTVIDAHQHFWRLSRGDYDWLSPNLGVLHRDHEPDELKPTLDANCVTGTVLVQAAARVEETRFLLSLADEHEWIRGVVGWVDFDDPSQAAADIERLASHPRFVGVRPMVQDIPDVGWLSRESHAPVWDAIAERGLMFDALVKPVHLENVARLLEDRPELACMINHGAKPEIAQGKGAGFWSWANWMQHIARESSACCKLSGLITEAGPNWSVNSLRPFVDVLLDAFGPNRLIWGSDWPVLNLAGDYGQWLHAARELLNGLSASEQVAVFGGNAIRAYQLEGAQV